ncbi:MAG: MBOAT family O-acyltransferase [Rhizomicrobium sp.]|jgi:D-alanyl-lipoteichoic acid acyltransferase DltB (MBOAT superfamily)
MLFTSPTFLFLLYPLALVAFYMLTPRFGASFGLGLLLIVSLLFYTAWGSFYFLLLICSITANFASVYFLLTTPDEKRYRRLFLWLGLVYDFGTLFWFKYRWFVVSTFTSGTAHDFSVVDLAIPVGISFYTFQQAIFLVDAYYRDASVLAYLGDMRGLWAKLRAYVRHAFFVAFFPHLLIGPIIYLKEFQPQIANPTFGKVRRRNLEAGLTLIALGLFKKIVIADHLAPLADLVFEVSHSHVALPAVTAWLGAMAYYAQLYFDFSGYSDMALGTARGLGIRFPINFYSPLKAVGIMDFYRRWHMTLTRAIARFFYIPLSLSGARAAQRWKLPKSSARILGQWLPLLLNFEAIALWHNARTTFVLFGIFHGAWYIAESEARKTRGWKLWCSMTTDRTRAFLGRAVFFIPMLLSFALFRSSSVADFFHLLAQMFGGMFTQSLHGLGLRYLGIIVPAYGVLWLFPNSMEFLRRYRPGIPTYENRIYGWKPFLIAWRPSWLWAVAVGALTLVSLHYMGQQPLFLYLGF